MQNQRGRDSPHIPMQMHLYVRVRAGICGRFAGSRASNAKPTDNVHTTYLLRHTYVCMDMYALIEYIRRRRRLIDIIIIINFIILIIIVIIMHY
jgi:hypothetical protein